MARKLFVTRHRGAVTWAAEGGVKARKIEMEDFDSVTVKPGDIVLGTLPVHIAAQVNAAGGHYWHLAMEIPVEYRGKELSAEMMRAFGARLEEFRVQALGVRMSDSPEHPGSAFAVAKTHFCIATGQALPNLLPLAALQWERVVIFASKDKERQANRLLSWANELAGIRGLQGTVAQIVELPKKLDWETLRAFAARQATLFGNDGPSDFNLTGGLKLMTLAFSEAFRSQSRLLYCSTDAECIHVVDTVLQSDVALKRDLLNVDLYLAAQGFSSLRSVSPADTVQFRKVMQRAALTGSIVLCTDMLSKAKFAGTASLGASTLSIQPLAYQVKTLLGLLHALGAEAREKAGKGSKPFRPQVRIESAQDNELNRRVWSAFEEFGLIRNLQINPVRDGNSMGVEFSFVDQDAAAFMGGGYLEEYVWLCLDALDLPRGHFAGNVGIGMPDPDAGLRNAELNELDAIAVWRNVALIIECKAGVQMYSAKDQDILNKLDQLKDNVGGALGRAWLVVPKRLDMALNAMIFERAALNGIQLVNGPREMKMLCARLARELRCGVKKAWPGLEFAPVFGAK